MGCRRYIELMKVEIHCLFESPDADDRANMASVARSLTDDLRSVRVFAIDGRPGWLAVEFAMPTQPQYQAVGAIDRELRFCVGNRMDSTIRFPRSEAEQRGAERKNARCRAKRRQSPKNTNPGSPPVPLIDMGPPEHQNGWWAG